MSEAPENQELVEESAAAIYAAADGEQDGAAEVEAEAGTEPEQG